MVTMVVAGRSKNAADQRHCADEGENDQNENEEQSPADKADDHDNLLDCHHIPRRCPGQPHYTERLRHCVSHDTPWFSRSVLG